MARLDKVANQSLVLGTPAAPELLEPGSLWRLEASLNGYSRPTGSGLATQARSGRCFQVLTGSSPDQLRRYVQLLEDGYRCWLNEADLIGRSVACGPTRPRQLNSRAIEQALPEVLQFAGTALQQTNHYLWGGNLGPDYDCSGFLQSAFAASGIWIPRDAYQQERFCQPVAVRPGQFSLLRPGDLVFFGNRQRCTHVGLHLGQGRYLHSSGREHGRDGLGIDRLSREVEDPVGRHYLAQLRGAGRVIRCHDGSTLP